MKNKIPKISVIMPNYNSEKYLKEVIESILNQTFSDFEFIIIDDGSSDRSWEIIQEYAKKDKRIIAIKNEKNLWVHKTRNKLFDFVKGEYIAMMDSDDICYPHRLQKQFDFLEKHNLYALCGTNFILIDEKWKEIGQKKFPETDKEIKESFFWRNPFGQNTVMMRTSVFDTIWWYDETLEVAEDLDMWVRIWTKYKMYNLQENLVKYRIHWKNSILTRQKEHIKNTLKIRKKALKLWYKMNFKWKIHYFGTWCMQFLPPKFVLWLFNLLQK